MKARGKHHFLPPTPAKWKTVKKEGERETGREKDRDRD